VQVRMHYGRRTQDDDERKQYVHNVSFDEFIITVFCWACERSRVITITSSLRRGGFASALSDEEVISRELWGKYFTLATDKALFPHFCTHYAHFFPHLKDRTLFVRQAANL
ncbi:MAG: hypothetical protein ACRD2L_10655, partial [Terriglobia bacterium]